MEKMNKPYVLIEYFFASIEKVWQALTDQNIMRIWYFPQLVKFEAIPGFKFEFKEDNSIYMKEWRVTEVQPLKKLSHSWVYKGFPGVSEVIFELTHQDEGTQLKLTHTGLESFLNDPHFARERFEQGWKTILGTNLKNYLDY